MATTVCGVTWCSAIAGASGFCGPHTRWPALEGEKVDAWTSRAARLLKALKKLQEEAEKVSAVLTDKPQATWEIVRATRLSSYSVTRALRYLREQGKVKREGKGSNIRYRKPEQVAA